jgi:hypothetical protein
MKSIIRNRVLLILVLLLQLVSSYGGTIDENHEKESHETSNASHAEHRHHIAAVVAATSNLDAKHTDLTLGGDYQYRLTSRWAIGGFGEAIFAEHTESLVGAPLWIYLSRSFWLRTGPGVEFAKESDGSHSRSSSEEGHQKTVAKFLFRVGAGYNFELSGMTIAPTLDFDFVRSANALVWGVSIGKGF